MQKLLLLLDKRIGSFKLNVMHTAQRQTELCCIKNKRIGAADAAQKPNPGVSETQQVMPRVQLLPKKAMPSP